MTALSSGAIRYWGDYDRKANNPLISTRTKYELKEGVDFCGGSTGIPCTTSYGRCGITPVAEQPSSFTSWKCFDNNNNALACDAGGITTPNNANCKIEEVRYYDTTITTNPGSTALYNSYSSTQCGAYLGKPAAIQTPNCPYTSTITLDADGKLQSPEPNAGALYKGKLIAGISQCASDSIDEYLCQSPVTAIVAGTSDMCYQVYDTGADVPVYLTTQTNDYTTTPVYCQLYDSAVGSTNPTWLPPQSSYSCDEPTSLTDYSKYSLTPYCNGNAGTYTFPAAGSTAFPHYSGYKCVPCWGGFDSRVTTGFSPDTPRRSILSTDALASLPISTAYGNIGPSSQRLGNCAAFMKQSSSGAAGSIVFWSEADTSAAVRRGRWENSVWSTGESIWPASMTTTHILGVTYSFTSDIPSLYAISPDTLFIS